MIFPNEILVKKQSNDNINHPTATTGLDRPSSFYNKTLSDGFKKHFKFDHPSEINEVAKKHVLVKKR